MKDRSGTGFAFVTLELKPFPWPSPSPQLCSDHSPGFSYPNCFSPFGWLSNAQDCVSRPWPCLFATKMMKIRTCHREAWRAAIHGVAKSRTRLNDWTELEWSSHVVSGQFGQFLPIGPSPQDSSFCEKCSELGRHLGEVCPQWGWDIISQKIGWGHLNAERAKRSITSEHKCLMTDTDNGQIATGFSPNSKILLAWESICEREKKRN